MRMAFLRNCLKCDISSVSHEYAFFEVVFVHLFSQSRIWELIQNQPRHPWESRDHRDIRTENESKRATLHAQSIHRAQTVEDFLAVAHQIVQRRLSLSDLPSRSNHGAL